MYRHDEQTRVRRLLVRRLAYWKREFLLGGGSLEAFAAVRLAVELDPAGDQINAGVPICAPGHTFPIGAAAKGVALARYCIENLEQSNTPLWREKRHALESLWKEYAIADALEPEVAQVRRWKEQRQEAGKKGGKAGQPRNSTREQVAAQWKRMDTEGVPERDRAGKIAKNLGITSAAVQQHVRSLGLRKAKGKLA